MQTVTFYSYKGGVGRSLTVANFAAYLAQLGIHSIVMDLDLEAPGQHFKFGTATEPLPVETGVVDILWSLVENQTIDAELVKKSLIKVDLGDATGSVYLLPAGSAPSLHYQNRLRQLDMRSLLGDSDLGGLGLLELREVLNELVTEQIGEEPSFLFIDSRTGITDLGKFACAFLADHLVAMFLDQPEHLEGTRAFLRSAASGPRLEEALKILPVVSRAPNGSRSVRSNSVADYLSEPAEILTSTLNFSEGQIFEIRHEPGLLEGEFISLRKLTNPSPGYQSDLVELVQEISPAVAEVLTSGENLERMTVLGARLFESGNFWDAQRRQQDVLTRIQGDLDDRFNAVRASVELPTLFQAKIDAQVQAALSELSRNIYPPNTAIEKAVEALTKGQKTQIESALSKVSESMRFELELNSIQANAAKAVEEASRSIDLGIEVTRAKDAIANSLASLQLESPNLQAAQDALTASLKAALAEQERLPNATNET